MTLNSRDAPAGRLYTPTSRYMHTFTLNPPARERKPTNIMIGEGLVELPQGGISSLSTLLNTDTFDRIVLLYDQGIEAIAKKLEQSIGSSLMLPVARTDASKSLAEVERLTTLMLNAGCTRNTLLVCIGGGMITDLGGFLASIFMRGIPCILIPTSLLAMVDAAIGGKTAVNAGGRKNMLGRLTHPMSVIIDPALLNDLPDQQFFEGLVEVIKIAAMVDGPFFAWIESSIQKVLAREPQTVEECITRAIQAKIRIVEADDYDRDVRLLLNFGHTVGHAVEALSQYKLSHGAAVSIGMAAEMAMSHAKDAARILALLEAVHMPVRIPQSMNASALWTVMQTDKKSEHGAVRIATPVRLGEGAVTSVKQDQFLTLFA